MAQNPLKNGPKPPNRPVRAAPLGFDSHWFGLFELGRVAGWLSWKFMSKRRVVVRKNLEVVNTWIQAQSAKNRLPSNDVKEALGTIESSGMSSIKCNLPSEIQRLRSLPIETQIKEAFQRAGANLFSGFPLNRMSAE